MTYKINDVALDPQPTWGRWSPRDPIGRTGEGRSILPGYRAYEMFWQLTPATGTYQLFEAWKLQASTGTSSVDLPTLGASPYAFQTYSGVFIEEPEVDQYFESSTLNVRLRVSRVAILS